MSGALYLQLLTLTVVVELWVVALVGGLAPGARRQLLVEALILNLTTHPLATSLQAEVVSFWSVEGLVVVTEAIGFTLLTPLSWGWALGLSLLANGATIGLSLWMFS